VASGLIPDANPITLTLRDTGHTITISDQGHTITIREARTVTVREQ
jgi:hypothetical protein